MPTIGWWIAPSSGSDEIRWKRNDSYLAGDQINFYGAWVELETDTSWHILNAIHPDTSWHITNALLPDISWHILTKIDHDFSWYITNAYLLDTSWYIVGDHPSAYLANFVHKGMKLTFIHKGSNYSFVHKGLTKEFTMFNKDDYPR